jgi:hypothetical protein
MSRLPARHDAQDNEKAENIRLPRTTISAMMTIKGTKIKF